MNWILAFLCVGERHAPLVFSSYEYSYSSLIFVEYSFLAIVCFLALVFRASLARAAGFVISYSHISLFNYLESLSFN